MIKSNRMKMIFYIASLVTLSLSNAFASGDTDTIRIDDTLESIAKRNAKTHIRFKKNIEDYQDKIKQWNPTITDWTHPPHNQLLYVDYPYNPWLTGSHWAAPLGKDESSLPDDIALNAYYSASTGSYSESVGIKNLTTSQNFPITFGFGFALADETRKNFLVSSVYWSSSSKANINQGQNTTQSELTLPSEIGGNIYYQYVLKKYNAGIYAGYDFERLNSYNLDEVSTGSQLKNVKNQLHYTTLGVTKSFILFDYNMNLKASYSNSYKSNSDSSSNNSLKGSKYIIYYSFRPTDEYSINIFYKQHNLQGNSEVSIKRYGLSFGLKIF
jgi:hypothetical protein